jgi:hypothetical protein
VEAVLVVAVAEVGKIFMIESERTPIPERIVKESLSKDFYNELGVISGK